MISQRLIPTTDGERLPVFEVMTVNAAIQNLIREGKTHQIDNAIYSGNGQNMLSMDTELQRLVREGRITRETALMYAVNRDTLERRLPPR